MGTYRLLGKLRPRAMPFTETLDCDVVDGVLASLFPRTKEEANIRSGSVNFENIPLTSVANEILAGARKWGLGKLFLGWGTWQSPGVNCECAGLHF